MTLLLRTLLKETISNSLRRAQEGGLLPQGPLPQVFVDRPSREEHGDYATNLALQLAPLARRPPLQVATAIVQTLERPEFVAEVRVAPPGFINFSLDPLWLAEHVGYILRCGEGYGNLDIGSGRKVQVEYVSANPTGPLHVGHGRGGALGDTIANVLQTAGYQVTREYYINDAGSRMIAFYQSLYSRYLQALGRDRPLPEEGYYGEYLVELGRELAEEFGERFANMPEDEAVTAIGRLGVARMVEAARRDLEAMNISFDVWFSEEDLYRRSLLTKTLEMLRNKGLVEERDGAVWFLSTRLGDDRDKVLIRSTGAPTYFASDIAYHYDKVAIRGFDQVIDVWGADHLGHVPFMKAAFRALGLDPDRLTVVICQLVTLKRGGEVVRMSKRTGDIITLREVVDEVGADACRYNFVSRSADAQMDFDLELAKLESNENPVYYIQYAHARLASVLRHAAQRGIEFTQADLSPLAKPPDLPLAKLLARFPEVVEDAALQLSPHKLAHYALELAGLFHSYYNAHRIVDEGQPALTRARLQLAQALKLVLGKTLDLLGMTAPESM
jgi:arginyl-tRNA synthetase